MTRWRLALACREALLSLASRPWLLAGQLAALVLVMAAPAAVEYDAANQLAAETERLRLAGSHVIIASAGDEGGLTAHGCSRAWDISAVTGVGWTRGAGSAAFLAAPDLAFRHLEVSPGAMALLGTSERTLAGGGRPTLAVGSLAAEELGVTDGGTIHLRTGRSAQPVGVRAAVVRLQGALGEKTERAVLTPSTGPGPVDECWIRFDHPVGPVDQEAVRAVIPPSAAENVSPLIRETNTLAARYPIRVSRFGWIAAGVTAAGILWLIDWFGRGETALYRALGLRRHDLLVLASLKDLLVLTWAAALATILALLTTWGEVPAAGYLLPLYHCGASALLGLALAVLAARKLSPDRLAAVLKDR